MSLSDPSENFHRKRAQVSRACARCRSQRRRCDDNRPCQRCIEAGISYDCIEIYRRETSATGPQLQYPGGLALSDLVHDEVLETCLKLFFERLFPTIPVLDFEHVQKLRTDALDGDCEAACVLAVLCSQVMLQVAMPEDPRIAGVQHPRNFGLNTLQIVQKTVRNFPPPPVPSYRRCLLLFFIYACQASMSKHSLAYITLREATTLFTLLQLNTEDPSVRDAAERLFWILLVSERSHAIRYRRPVSLQASSSGLRQESSLLRFHGLSALVGLFKPITTAFIALLNQEIPATDLAPGYLYGADEAISSSLGDARSLSQAQRANLYVTQAWLRIIIWQLRLRERQLVEVSSRESETLRWPVSLAHALMHKICEFDTSSLRIHGVGLTEKLFDIASALVDVEARVPSSPTECLARGNLQQDPRETLPFMRHMIRRLPGGEDLYDGLLEAHIQQAYALT